jgi:hypothetical protein
MSAGQIKMCLPKDKIADFCRRHYIRKLAVFGAVLRGACGRTAILTSWWNSNQDTCQGWHFSVWSRSFQSC